MKRRLMGPPMRCTHARTHISARTHTHKAGQPVHAKKKALGRAFAPTLRVSTRDLGHAAQIRIRDNGTGIAAEVRDRIYQPFFTTKPTGDGTGLGLSISNDIVREQGGTLEVETEEGQFTEFVITLPRKAPAR